MENKKHTKTAPVSADGNDDDWDEVVDAAVNDGVFASDSEPEPTQREPKKKSKKEKPHPTPEVSDAESEEGGGDDDEGDEETTKTKKSVRPPAELILLSRLDKPDPKTDDSTDTKFAHFEGVEYPHWRVLTKDAELCGTLAKKTEHRRSSACPWLQPKSSDVAAMGTKNLVTLVLVDNIGKPHAVPVPDGGLTLVYMHALVAPGPGSGKVTYVPVGPKVSTAFSLLMWEAFAGANGEKKSAKAMAEYVVKHNNRDKKGMPIIIEQKAHELAAKAGKRIVHPVITTEELKKIYSGSAPTKPSKEEPPVAAKLAPAKAPKEDPPAATKPPPVKAPKEDPPAVAPKLAPVVEQKLDAVIAAVNRLVSVVAQLGPTVQAAVRGVVPDIEAAIKETLHSMEGGSAYSESAAAESDNESVESDSSEVVQRAKSIHKQSIKEWKADQKGGDHYDEPTYEEALVTAREEASRAPKNSKKRQREVVVSDDDRDAEPAPKKTKAKPSVAASFVCTEASDSD